MQATVLNSRQNHQVRRVVIVLVAIDVVNMLVRPELAAGNFLADHAMLVAAMKLSIGGRLDHIEALQNGSALTLCALFLRNDDVRRSMNAPPLGMRLAQRATKFPRGLVASLD